MNNFYNAGANKVFSEVSRKANEKAQVIVIQNIRSENIYDDPNNGEDIQFTEDLELAIRENGFTDPIEVTDFNQPEGKYMILSGHRRRAAGVKNGMDIFPCIVRHFDNETDVRNYVLMSNAHRDSAKDPLLFAKRYVMHRDYLKASGFKGSIRREIAGRLGLSTQQIDRYAALTQVITPVLDLVTEEKVGAFSVSPMSTSTEEEQLGMYEIMQEAMANEVELSRAVVKRIIDGYRSGKRTWEEIQSGTRTVAIPAPVVPAPPLGDGSLLRQLPVTWGDENMVSDAELARLEASVQDVWMDDYIQERQTALKKDAAFEVSVVEENEPAPTNGNTGAIKKGSVVPYVIAQRSRLDSVLGKSYHCASRDEGKDVMKSMYDMVVTILRQMHEISNQFELSAEMTEYLARLNAQNHG